jgi:hypothetical protein
MKTYRAFTKDGAVPGSIVIKFYHSGNQIRGYLRRIAEPGEHDTIFAGEEMEPEAAFKMANEHADDTHPILIELSEGVRWDPGWGTML